MKEELYDVIIIGGGPAGLSAAQYASRANLKTIVLDKSPTAGALAYTSKIENYPGLVDYFYKNMPHKQNKDTSFDKFGERDPRYEQSKIPTYLGTLSQAERDKFSDIGEDLDKLNYTDPEKRLQDSRNTGKSIPNRDWKVKGDP